MTQKKRHDLSVDGTGTGYRALCLCGWSGPVRALLPAAHTDAQETQHEYATYTPWLYRRRK